MKRVVLCVEAQEDLRLLVDWYNSKQIGLGYEFLRCFDARMEFLSQYPGVGSIAHGEELRVIVKRFPVSVYYRDLDDIYIRAVFHQKLDLDG